MIFLCTGNGPRGIGWGGKINRARALLLKKPEDIMECHRCHGLMVHEFFTDHQGSPFQEPVDALKCLNCGARAEQGRRYGQLASGEIGAGAGQVKGSGRYLNCVGRGPAWTAPNVEDVEA